MTNMNNRTGIWQLLAYNVIQLLEMEIVSLEQSAFPIWPLGQSPPT